VNRGLRNRRRFGSDDEANPLEGAINIVDAMLVFACGLMLALVIRWDVDLSKVNDNINLSKGQEISQNTDIRDDLVESKDQGDLYEKLGTAYKDPATGKVFILSDE
jgi:hypothetical protein